MLACVMIFASSLPPFGLLEAFRVTGLSAVPFHHKPHLLPVADGHLSATCGADDTKATCDVSAVGGDTGEGGCATFNLNFKLLSRSSPLDYFADTTITP